MGDGSPGPGDGRGPSSGRDQATTLLLRVLQAVARVLVRVSTVVSRGVNRLAGQQSSAGREDISEAELRDLVARSRVLDREERRLIDDVIAAGDRHVRELMVPRTEAVFLDAGMTIADAVTVVRGTPHSRFPVGYGSHDDVVGFVHLRDLLLRAADDDRHTVGELARPVRRLPAGKPALAALSEMRRAGDHLAVVVDEYGGTAGIVTLEDLIEELVGEVHDEYDAAPEVQVAGVAPAEVDGLLNLSDFTERVGLALSPGPYDTLGGYLMAALGRLPQPGDEVVVDAPGGLWRLVVLRLDGRRVDRVGVNPPRPAPVAEVVPERMLEPIGVLVTS